MEQKKVKCHICGERLALEDAFCRQVAGYVLYECPIHAEKADEMREKSLVDDVTIL